MVFGWHHREKREGEEGDERGAIVDTYNLRIEIMTILPRHALMIPFLSIRALNSSPVFVDRVIIENSFIIVCWQLFIINLFILGASHIARRSTRFPIPTSAGFIPGTLI